MTDHKNCTTSKYKKFIFLRPKYLVTINTPTGIDNRTGVRISTPGNANLFFK